MGPIDLDHVAIAAHDVKPTMDALTSELGAVVLYGGASIGFRAVQVDAGDLRIELLEPWNVEANDFLVRFLERHGEGPHHLTFKTNDIRRELKRAEEAGYQPVGVRIDNPWWQEAFLHPSQAGGTVVQIAQSGIEDDQLDREVREYGPGRWWDPPPAPSDDRAIQSEGGASRAILRRVVVTSDETGRALGLYADLLGGSTVDHGEGWIELGWPGGGRIRVEAAAQRPEGISRLEWTHRGPRSELTIGGTAVVLYPES
jgi:hypothetical protein